MPQRRIAERLIGRHAREYDVIGALGVELDVAVGGAQDDGHALARAGELEHVEHLVALLDAEHLDRDEVRRARRKHETCAHTQQNVRTPRS